MMTLKEFITDLERETGERLSGSAARALYSQYREHEAEAITGGRDDVDPAIEESKRVSEMLAKPFKVVCETPRYCVHTDGLIGATRHILGGFETREDAESAMQVMYFPEDSSAWIEPRESYKGDFSKPVEDDDFPF